MNFDFAYYLGEYLDYGVILLNLISNSFGALLSVGVYVLTSLGLYTIAKRRAISKAWLAWVPVVDCWLLGCISDQYRYVALGQVKSKRKSLLVLTIVQMALWFAIMVTAIIAGIGLIGSPAWGMGQMYWMQSLMVPGMVLVGLCLPLAGVVIAKTIIYYMALYDLYASCAPDNSVVFLVLSIIFRITKPFFIFFNRNSDKGMPPRRETYQEM